MARVPVPGRGVARVPQNAESTSLIRPTEAEPPPVFVDDSGRRGRWVTWLSLGLAMLGLLLVVALWISQATATGS